MDPKVILETARNREEISAIEALMILQAGEEILPLLYEVADQLNRRLTDNVVTYVRSKQIHYTNVCKAECQFCTFYRRKGQKSAFALSIDEILRQIREAAGLRQVILQGGLNPDLTLPHHVDLLRAIKDTFPNLHIHGYSPAEIFYIAKRARTTPYDVLRKFKEAGLDSLSGDSAMILNDKLRKKICPDILRTSDWHELVKCAHRMGLSTTATVLFGHIEDEIQLCEHLEILKYIQRETGGFSAIEPVPFVPSGSELARRKGIKKMISMDRILKMYAVTRIFTARCIKNIQADWTKLGLEGVLRVLSVGANDIVSLAFDPHEIRIPDVNGKHLLPSTTLRGALLKAGRSPMERDPYTLRSTQAPRPRREEPVLV